jgi:hypothetical protein
MLPGWLAWVQDSFQRKLLLAASTILYDKEFLETLPVLQATDPQELGASCCMVRGFEVFTAVWVNIPFFCRMTLL